MTYTLKACTRLDNTVVRCAFALQSQYPNRPFLNAADWTATTATGVVIPGDRAESSGKVLDSIGAVDLPKGNVEVPYSVFFKLPVNENMVTVLTINANQKIVFNQVPIQGAPQVVSSLPGQAVWRKSVRWQNRDFVALVPGCYAAGATATCYVLLFPSNAKGTVDGQALSYPATALQLQRQPVANGRATVTVGKTIFTDIPVR